MEGCTNLLENFSLLKKNIVYNYTKISERDEEANCSRSISYNKSTFSWKGAGKGHWRMEERYGRGTSVVGFLKVLISIVGTDKLQNVIRQVFLKHKSMFLCRLCHKLDEDTSFVGGYISCLNFSSLWNEELGLKLVVFKLYCTWGSPGMLIWKIYFFLKTPFTGDCGTCN